MILQRLHSYTCSYLLGHTNKITCFSGPPASFFPPRGGVLYIFLVKVVRTTVPQRLLNLHHVMPLPHTYTCACTLSMGVGSGSETSLVPMLLGGGGKKDSLVPKSLGTRLGTRLAMLLFLVCMPLLVSTKIVSIRGKICQQERLEDCKLWVVIVLVRWNLCIVGILQVSWMCSRSMVVLFDVKKPKKKSLIPSSI